MGAGSEWPLTPVDKLAATGPSSLQDVYSLQLDHGIIDLAGFTIEVPKQLRLSVDLLIFHQAEVSTGKHIA